MRLLQKNSVSRQFTLAIMTTTSAALALACAAFFWYDSVTFRRTLASHISATADVIGQNCAAALDFSDAAAAAEILGGLRATPRIDAACVYLPDGTAFATFNRDDSKPFTPPAMSAPSQGFTGDQFQLFRLIRVKEATIGTIFITCDFSSDLRARLLTYTGIVFGVFALSALAALAISQAFQKAITVPILKLAEVARVIAAEKDYSMRVAAHSDNELGALGNAFNRMLEQVETADSALKAARDQLEQRVVERTSELEKTHAELVHASRRGGMAEIATNVLHNVGNVLNSVNISAGLIQDTVKKSKAPNFAKVAALVAEHQHDLASFVANDARGKHLPAYLAEFSDRLQDDHRLIQHELDSLRKNVEHIKEIVSMQQSYAKFGAVLEVVDVKSIVEDALRMDEGAMGRHRVEVIREIASVPTIECEKHKVLQILVNLLRNAKQACLETERTDKQVKVQVASRGDRVTISVIDNGIGIPAENLLRIFNHGFTTKKDGHGFGLHGSALAAAEMGGSLTAQSDGVGRGASFTLDLPWRHRGT